MFQHARDQIADGVVVDFRGQIPQADALMPIALAGPERRFGRVAAADDPGGLQQVLGRIQHQDRRHRLPDLLTAADAAAEKRRLGLVTAPVAVGQALLAEIFEIAGQVRRQIQPRAAVGIECRFDLALGPQYLAQQVVGRKEVRRLADQALGHAPGLGQGAGAVEDVGEIQARLHAGRAQSQDLFDERSGALTIALEGGHDRQSLQRSGVVGVMVQHLGEQGLSLARPARRSATTAPSPPPVEGCASRHRRSPARSCRRCCRP